MSGQSPIGQRVSTSGKTHTAASYKCLWLIQGHSNIIIAGTDAQYKCLWWIQGASNIIIVGPDAQY